MPWVNVPGFGNVHINTRGCQKRATRHELEQIGLVVAKAAETVQKELKPMATQAIAKVQDSPIAITTLNQVITGGDLGKLTEVQLVDYYVDMCLSLGLNWRTKPFDVIAFKDGRKRLYLNAEGAEQLAALHNVNVTVVLTEQIKDIYKITLKAELPNGRSVTKSGATTIGKLEGDALANALMKAETKAYRRAVRAVCGLNGLLEQRETVAFPRPADAAEVLADVITHAGEDVSLATEEEVAEIPEVDVQELTPLQLAKRRAWSMAQTRGLSLEDLQKLAGIYNFELDNGSIEEYEEITKQMIDHEDTKALIDQYRG